MTQFYLRRSVVVDPLRYVLSVTGISLAPLSAVAGAGCLAISLFPQLKLRRSQQLPLVLVIAIISLYSLLAMDLVRAAINVGAFSALALAAADARLTPERKISLALGLFVAGSLMAMVIGIGVNDNRIYTSANLLFRERLSFALVPSPSLGAQLSGAALLWALLSGRDAMSKALRALLALGGGFLLLAANYRFELGLVILLCVAGLALRHRTEGIQRRVLVGAAIALLLLPLWWLPIASAVERHLVAREAVLAEFSRARDVNAFEEFATFNSRTMVWRANFDLFSRSSIQELVFGYGTEGGDAAYQRQIGLMFGANYRDTSVISSHSTLLDLMRRGGMFGFGLVLALVAAFARNAKYMSFRALTVMSLLIAAGGAGLSITPNASLHVLVALSVLFGSRQTYLKERKRSEPAQRSAIGMDDLHMGGAKS